ncbi:permease [Liquorilactobacillus sucicola DSM 21376 = JCM 15457]|uniref:Major facilitator superfamily protein n=2 Tax=Liquorilactobacillus sucicola TaxID=519050 RepID=A0A023CXX1_9LACO|nr:major facilitator superfamily protein [Liquorilactobacillus sucicola DSM 21376 = JCM 15457]GAJ26733.1 permease [Liquorilactobacillus sucicola DSM 21376 = JCM 15457]
MVGHFMKNRTRIWIMIAIFIATFMTSVEITIVTTALPSIISELHGLAYQSWIMSTYLLTTAITTPIYGKLADSWGRKIVFQVGVILFTLGSLLSGLSPSIFSLILARALQGLGAGSIIPLTFTIIADIYSFQDRAKVLAFNNTAWGLSALLGPLLGGFLVDTLSWHWVFFVNVPLGVLIFLVITFKYTETLAAKTVLHIDWYGICWLSITLIALLIGIQQINISIRSSIILFSVSLLSFFLLIKQEKKVSDPLIPFEMFVNPTFSIQVVTSTLLSGILIGYQIYFPIWLQSIYRVPATISGLVVTSSSVMWLLASFLVGGLLRRFSPKNIILVVVSVQFISYLSLLFINSSFPYWVFYLIAAISGFGMGIVISINIMLSQHLVSKKLLGSATAIITLGRTLGQTLMIGIYGAVLNLFIRLQLHGLRFSAVNNFISSTNKIDIHLQQIFAPIVLNSLHAVFGVVNLLFIVILVTNMLDPNKEVIR